MEPPGWGSPVKTWRSITSAHLQRTLNKRQLVRCASAYLLKMVSVGYTETVVGDSHQLSDEYMGFATDGETKISLRGFEIIQR